MERGSERVESERGAQATEDDLPDGALMADAPEFDR